MQAEINIKADSVEELQALFSKPSEAKDEPVEKPKPTLEVVKHAMGTPLEVPKGQVVMTYDSGSWSIWYGPDKISNFESYIVLPNNNELGE